MPAPMALSLRSRGDAARSEAFLDTWLSELAAASDADAAFRAASRSLESLGLDRLIYLIADERSDATTVHSTMPAWWHDQFREEGLAAHDPFLRYCCDRFQVTPTGEAFVERHDFLCAEERAFIHKGGDAGLRAGIALPVSLRGTGRIGGFNVGGATSSRALTRLLRAYGPAVRVGLLHTHQAITRAREGNVPHLSRRERECLVLLAQGNQSKQIAARLGVSYTTVEFHMRNARGKLRAATREQAVARAVWLGLIAL